MENVLRQAKRLGVEFGEIEGDLDRLSQLQQLLQDAGREGLFLMEAGENSVVQDKVAQRVREEIESLSRKIRCRRLFISVAA